MENEDLKKVVDFYENVICQQIIKPVEIDPIYKLVKPDGMQVPYHQKMRAITIYVQGLQSHVLEELEKMFDEFDKEQETITNDPRLSTYIPPEDNQVDNTETNLPKDSDTISVDNTNQSHEESETTHENFVAPDNQKSVTVSSVENNNKLSSELQELEAKYAKAETANEKRSLKMKINKLKKDAKNS